MEICLIGVAIRFVKYTNSSHQYGIFEIGRVANAELEALEKAYTQQLRTIDGDPTNGTLQQKKVASSFCTVRLCLFVGNICAGSDPIEKECENSEVTITYIPANIRPTLRRIEHSSLGLHTTLKWFTRFPVDWDVKEDKDDVLILREGKPASYMLTQKAKEGITTLSLDTRPDGRPIFHNKVEVMAQLFLYNFPNATVRWVYPSGNFPKTTVCFDVGCRGKVSFSTWDAYERVDIHVFDWANSCHIARLENVQRIITFESGWKWEEFVPPSEDMAKLMDEIVKFFKYHAKKYQDLFHQTLFDVIEEKKPEPDGPEKKEEKQMDKQDSLTVRLEDVKVRVLGCYMTAMGDERTDVRLFWDSVKKHYKTHYFYKLWISNVDSGNVGLQLQRIANNVSKFKDVSAFNNGYTITVYDESDSLVDGDHVILRLVGMRGTAATMLKTCICDKPEIYIDSCPKLTEIGKKKAEVVFTILHDQYKSVGRPDGTFIVDETGTYLAECDEDESVILIRHRNNRTTLARIDVDKIMNVSQDDPLTALTPWGLGTPAKAFAHGIIKHLRANRVKYWIRLNGEVDLTPQQIILKYAGNPVTCDIPVLTGIKPATRKVLTSCDFLGRLRTFTEEYRAVIREQFKHDLERAYELGRKQPEEPQTTTNKEEKEMTIKDIKEVRFCGRTTVIKWNDGTYTAVKRAEEDSDDRQKAIALCVIKRNMGNKKSYVRALDKIVSRAAKAAATDAEKAVAKAEEKNSPVKWVEDNSGMFWTCQTEGCGHTNNADAKFCIACGAAKPKMWKCGCGAVNEHIAQYCAQCGKIRKDLDTVVVDSYVDGKPVETPKKPAAKKAATKKPTTKKS